MKSGSLENDAAAAGDQPPDMPAAFGTRINSFIVHILELSETMSAFGTFVFVCRHAFASILFPGFRRIPGVGF